MTNQTTYFVAAIVVVVLAWAIVAMLPGRKKKKETDAGVIRDWIATGRINLVARHSGAELTDDDTPTDFILLVEESRLIKDIGDGGYPEVRWRKPSRREARSIVQTYQSQMKDRIVPHESLQRSPFGRVLSQAGGAYTPPETFLTPQLEPPQDSK